MQTLQEEEEMVVSPEFEQKGFDPTTASTKNQDIQPPNQNAQIPYRTSDFHALLQENFGQNLSQRRGQGHFLLDETMLQDYSMDQSMATQNLTVALS